MGRQKIPLGKILGIPIGLDYSWFLIFILLTWTLAVSYFPGEFNNWPAVEYWLVGAVTAIMLFVSVFLHELGHSVVALRYKVPVRSITLFIFGGIAQIASEPPSATAEFWIAIAGPIVSFTLAGIFAFLQSIFSGIAPLLALFKYLAYINGTLGLFNLIPGFPLDGGRVFRAILWGTTHKLHRATQIAANVGRGVAYLFILFGVWQMFNGNFGGGLWIAFIGWFLESAASSQLHQETLQNLLAGHTVSQAMNRRKYTTLSPEITVRNLVDNHILGKGQRSFIVGRNGDSLGLLNLDDLKQLPSEAWADTTLAQVMVPLDTITRAKPTTELWEAVQMMEQNRVSQLPVMQDGQLLGILDREDISGFLHSLREFNNP